MNAENDAARVLALIDDATQQRLHALLAYVLEANQTLNLTSVRDAETAWHKHILDSLHGLRSKLFESESRVLDLGTGAGFPGLVLAMARPNLHITLMDATRKKCDFVTRAIRHFQLNAQVLHGRAEDFGHDTTFRETFNVVTARAVGSLPEVCELALPLARVGGHVVLWRGKDALAELASSRRALHRLGAASTRAPIAYELSGHELKYHLVVVDKREAAAPAFPRRNGLPKTKPL
jgi:16S rRNA (guanine527-N7)-methyltransferase